MANKTKNQSTYDFFESLQSEYIVAYIRSKTYPGSRNRNYYKNRVMRGKREKIEEISARNGIRSIFDDKSLYEAVYSSVVPDWGIPKYTYTSEENRNAQEEQDWLNYFSIDADIAIREEDRLVSVGIIVDNSSVFSHHIVEVKRKKDSRSIVVPIDRVKRII